MAFGRVLELGRSISDKASVSDGIGASYEERSRGLGKEDVAANTLTQHLRQQIQSQST